MHLHKRLALALLAACCAGCAAPRAGVVRAGGVVYPDDPATLAERVLAGNIHQAGSDAYNRWGAGYDERLVASDRKLQWIARERNGL